MRRLPILFAIAWLVVSAPAIGMTKTDLPSPLAAIRQPLRSATMLQNLNKQMTVEGFYYDGSIPMIINDMSLLQMNQILPADSYIPIVGIKPSNVKWGDRISITGTVERSSGALIKEPAVIRITAPANTRIITPSATRFQSSIKLSLGTIKVITAELKAPYAVLIAGGYDAANNHIRYWNDLKAMYNILLSRGYTASHITVLFADGAAKDNGMPVNGPATKASIDSAFTVLAGKIGADNDVYIMTTDHGCQMGAGHSGLCLWGENMIDTDFANEVNKITTCKHMMIVMEQCFSGGFVTPLTKPNRVVMTACNASQPSWALRLDFDEFTFWYMSALQGSLIDGAAGTVNADTSGDSKVSIMEAWNYGRANDHASEVPQYEDNGAAPCASGGSMPRAGEGTLGAACWLQ